MRIGLTILIIAPPVARFMRKTEFCAPPTMTSAGIAMCARIGRGCIARVACDVMRCSVSPLIGMRNWRPQVD